MHDGDTLDLWTDAAEPFRALVEATSQIVWTADAAGNLVGDSPSWRAFTGQSLEDWRGNRWADAVHPDDRADAAEAWRGAIAGGESAAARFRLRHAATATWRWVQVQAVPLREADGTVRGFIGMNTDVTAVQEAEDALRQSEERFRRMAAAVPDLLFSAGADGRVDYVNEQFETFTGQPRDAGLGTPLWPHLVHPDDRERMAERWADARRTGAPFEARHRLLSASGHAHVITRALPTRTEAGEVVAWFGTVTDIDELARTEATVRRLNATLEERVARRTLQVRRLSARLADAEHAERRRLAHVLHDDLQQQLAGLGLLLDLALTARSDDERRDLGTRATAILDAATDLTRSLASELSPSVLASDRLEDLIRWVARRAGDLHHLDVDVEVPGRCTVPDPSVRALVLHALNEILFNVVKHAGTRRATVHAHRRGDTVTVAVTDEGAGFDVDAVHATETGGFGLASIRERVELVGGRLDLASASGQGTTVTLALPCGESVPPDAADGPPLHDLA